MTLFLSLNDVASIAFLMRIVENLAHTFFREQNLQGVALFSQLMRPHVSVWWEC
jgi:hypothetical protein